MRLIVRLLAGAVALAAAAWLIEGISIGPGPGRTGLQPARRGGHLRVGQRHHPPDRALISIPPFLTLGLFTFVVNALMLMLTAWIGDQFDLAFEVDGFGSALLVGPGDQRGHVRDQRGPARQVRGPSTGGPAQATEAGARAAAAWRGSSGRARPG